MDMVVLQMFIKAALEIYERHFAATGEKLTDEQVTEMLRAELSDGNHAIAEWFASKGLSLPL